MIPVLTPARNRMTRAHTLERWALATHASHAFKWREVPRMVRYPSICQMSGFLARVANERERAT